MSFKQIKFLTVRSLWWRICLCRSKHWESVVGLEIHAQIKSESKLFSGASTTFGGLVNNQVSLFDAALPGTLPVLNKRCVEAGVTVALAMSCVINPVSSFDRKHYFYADLPAGYQITQQRMPLAKNGHINFPVFVPGIHKTPYLKTSKIKQIQLEQDSGKSLHDEDPPRSLIDLNRAGIPLLELVFEPDLTDGEEAAALVKELSLILLRTNTCSCKMEEGALRVDANVSLNKKGKKLGTRTEIKNIGSVRGVARAIAEEIKRQKYILENGGEIINETRAWDATSGTTLPMRDKEVKQDYRFMPEPNLPPLRLNLGENESKTLINVSHLKNQIPELPEETRNNLRTKYGLPPELVFQIVNEEQRLHYFKLLTSDNPQRNPTLVAKFLTIELMTLVNKGLDNFNLSNFDHTILGEVIDLFQEETINLLTARLVLEEALNNHLVRPGEIVKQRGWTQLNDHKTLTGICANAIEKNPKLVEQYKSGKTKVFPALVGYIAKSTNNLANMKLVSTILKEMLKNKTSV